MASAEEVYSSLIEPIEDRMMRTVARIVRNPDDAADAFQNVLLLIWKDLAKIHRHPNPHGYILRVCMSVSYDCVRKRSRNHRREVLLDDSGVLPAEGRGVGDFSAFEGEKEILKAIASLPPQQAQAVLLQAVEEESFEQIAQSLGCSEATARSHVSKGKARLRQVLGNSLPQIAAKETR